MCIFIKYQDQEDNVMFDFSGIYELENIREDKVQIIDFGILERFHYEEKKSKYVM
jgi:hypothetical protein